MRTLFAVVLMLLVAVGGQLPSVLVAKGGSVGRATTKSTDGTVSDWLPPGRDRLRMLGIDQFAAPGVAGEPGWHEDSEAQANATSFSAQLVELFPSLKESLAISATFTPASWSIAGRAVTGLQLSDEPRVPAGLKPEEQAAWLAMTKRQGSASSADLAMFFAQSYQDGCAVRVGGLEVWSRPVGGSASAVADDQGRLVYRDAYHHADVIHAVAPGRSEEFIHLADRSAPTHFDYVLSTPTGDLRIVADHGGLLLSDAAGHQVKIEAPWVIDAKGAKSAAATHWDIGADSTDGQKRISLHLDPSGLTYPLVIDPTWVGTWTPTAPLLGSGAELAARDGHTALLLPGGDVLVCGGAGQIALSPSGYREGYLSNSQVYNPSTGSWRLTGQLGIARWGNQMNVKSTNGQVVVTGGQNGSNSWNFFPSAEYYSETGPSYCCEYWNTATVGMNSGRAGHKAVSLPSGAILLTGGRNALSGGALSDCEMNPSGSWVVTGSMSTRRYAHTATLLSSGKVLVTGGTDGTSSGRGLLILKTCELYSPSTGTWTATGAMSEVRASHTATLLSSGKVLVAGGTQVTGCELYDPSTGIWTAAGALAEYRDTGHTATLLSTGHVLVAGGTGLMGNLKGCELYDPSVNAWTATASLVEGRFSHTATLLSNGTVLVTGSGGAYKKASCELFSLTSGATVTIDQASVQIDPSTNLSIAFTAIFSEAVSGFTGSDVNLSSSTAGGTLIAVVGTSTDGGITWPITVTGMTTTGAVIASIPANAADGVAAPNRPNAASTSTDNRVQWGGPLSVTINQAIGQADPASNTSISFTAVFSEAVTGFTGSDVTLGGTVGGTLVATVSTSNNITWNVTVTGMASSAGTVTVAIPATKVLGTANQANGASTSTDNSVTWNLPIGLTVNQAVAQADPETGSSVLFTAVFAEAVTGFTGADVVISGSAGGTKTATVATTDNITYTITVTGMAASSGTVIVNIPAGGAAAVAAPNAGNALAISTDNTVTWIAPAGSGGGGAAAGGGGGGGCGLGSGLGALAFALMLALRFALRGSRPQRIRS